MKIIEIIPQLSSGGGERFTVDLCNELSKKGHEVILIVLFPLNNPDYSFYLPELSKDIKVISMNKKKGADLSLPFRLKRIINENNPDVVHTHLRALTYVSLSCLWKNKIKYIHTVHNAADKEAGGKITTLLRNILFKRKLMTPVTISEESYKSFYEFYHMDAPMVFNGRNIAENIEVQDDVRNEVESHKQNVNTRILVNIARFTDVKRQDLIARISKRLYGEGFNFSVLLIGNTRDNEILKRVYKTYSPNVFVMGEKSNPLSYLSISDGFCLMSSHEGMPISLIEAMGCGAVPICTPVGGIVDVIKDGYNGFLADSIEEEDCYRAMKRFLTMEKSDLDIMKNNVKESYRPYSMNECADNYIKIMSNDKNKG